MRPDDPARLTPDGRLRALAGLLAAGLRRLRRRPPAGPLPARENPLKLVADGLELGGETRLSVPTS